MNESTWIFVRKIGFVLAIMIIIYLVTITSERYEEKVMSISWCYTEYEVDGTPKIESRYACK